MANYSILMSALYDTKAFVSAIASKGFIRKTWIQLTKLSTLKKGLLCTAISIGVCSLPVSTAQAKLPAPIQHALIQANIPANNVSMIIMPVKQLTYSNNQAGTTYSSPDAISILSNVVPESSPIEEEVNQQPPLVPAHKQQSTDPPSSGLPIRHYPSVLRTPASVMKLVPTFIALDMLGPEFRWMTKIYHTGIVIDDTLYGDLIIKGSGDPKLTHEHLAILLASVKQQGIYHIRGNIVLDTSIFQEVAKNPADFDDQASRPYNVSPDGLLINFNSLEINAVVPSNARAARLFYTPRLADFSLPKQLPIRQAACKSIASSLAPTWQESALTFQKKLPKACNLRTFYLAYPDTKDFAKRAVKQQWLDLNTTLTGRITSTERPRLNNFDSYLTPTMPIASIPPTTIEAPTYPWSVLRTIPASLLPIVTYASAPLSQQIYDINHYSNNVMSEQLMLSLAAYGNQIDYHHTKDKIANKNRQVPSSPSSPSLPLTDSQQLIESIQTQSANYPKALALVNRWWQTHLTSKPPNLTNGSGLCRSCSVTADNIAELLEYAYHHPDFDTYLNSLGAAGMSGTIKHHAQRLPNSAAIGHAWIKTGTLDNASAMAGYVHSNSGQDYIVVGLINDADHLNTSGARHVLDIMLDWTARQ